MLNRYSSKVIVLSAACLLLAAAAAGSPNPPAAPAAAGSEEKTPYMVPRVNSYIKLDGVLDEHIWKEALVLEPAYEVQPGENIPAHVRTVAYLAYDEANLYVAFIAYDPEPSKIRACYTDRDQLWDDDYVAIFLDTFNSGRRDYGFICNPLGVQADIIESTQGGGGQWDAIWDSAGRITDEGYIVEMRIPFRCLHFQRTAGDQIWGIDVVRDVPRSVRHHIGLFPRDRNNNCYMCQAEKLIGFADVDPGRNLEFDPTVSAILAQEREDGTEGNFVDSERKFDPGFTAHWGFTPNLTASATANPDFSQVEADALQLDINNQFAIFYPEKRSFFMKGFDFLNLPRFNPVHTRTIADPDWGMKLTGKEGANAINFFTAQDALTNLIFPGSYGSDDTSLDMKNFSSVLRFRRDVGGSSNAGLIVTDREGDGYHNRLAGLDVNMRFTPADIVQFQFLGSQTAYPEETAAEFDQPPGDFTGTALELYYLHGTKTLDYYALYHELGDDFRADLGYMPQSDVRYGEAGFGYTWWNEPDNWYNMLNFGSSYNYGETHDGGLLRSGVEYWFDYNGLKQSYVHGNGWLGKQGYNGREFDTWSLHADVGFRPFGPLNFNMCNSGGESIDYANTRKGKQFHTSPGIELRLGRHLYLNANHTYELMNIGGERLYTANTSRLRAVYQFNRRILLRAIVQYITYDRNVDLYIDEVDARNEYLLSQFLFSYKINPQTVLYLGYSDNYYGDRDVSITQTDRTFFAKIGYAWTL